MRGRLYVATATKIRTKNLLLALLVPKNASTDSPASPAKTPEEEPLERVAPWGAQLADFAEHQKSSRNQYPSKTLDTTDKTPANE
jgi:hypothetical protein